MTWYVLSGGVSLLTGIAVAVWSQRAPSGGAEVIQDEPSPQFRMPDNIGIDYLPGTQDAALPQDATVAVWSQRAPS